MGTTSSAGYGSAFLGPNLWERPSGDNDFDLEYMDLDEFLSENGIPVDLDDMVQDAVSIGLVWLYKRVNSPTKRFVYSEQTENDKLIRPNKKNKCVSGNGSESFR